MTTNVGIQDCYCRTQMCDECAGAGDVPCEFCGGSGELLGVEDGEDSFCLECEGTGRIDCPECSGLGNIEVKCSAHGGL